MDKDNEDKKKYSWCIMAGDDPNYATEEEIEEFERFWKKLIEKKADEGDPQFLMLLPRDDPRRRDL